MSNVWKRVVPEDEPAPDTATVDQIMALVNDYAHGDHETAQPASVRWASIRAAVERVIAEKATAHSNWQLERASRWIEQERAERSEAAYAEVTKYCNEREGVLKQLERAEAERDALRALLEETLRPGAYGIGSTLAARIAAALKNGEQAPKRKLSTTGGAK